MPAKAKKSAVMKPRTQIIEVEIIPELTPQAVVKQLSQVEETVARASSMSDAKIVTSIKDYSSRATKHAHTAVESGASALVYAWGSGKLLNAAKTKLGRGDFGDWRKKHLCDDITERTSQRYMQLAKRYEDVRALLEWSPSLRQAYIACGILPEPPERAADEESDADEIKRQALLSSITGIQKKLRLFYGLKGKLGAGDKTQLKLAKQQIDEFLQQILN